MRYEIFQVFEGDIGNSGADEYRLVYTTKDEADAKQKLAFLRETIKSSWTTYELKLAIDPE